MARFPQGEGRRLVGLVPLSRARNRAGNSDKAHSKDMLDKPARNSEVDSSHRRAGSTHRALDTHSASNVVANQLPRREPMPLQRLFLAELEGLLWRALGSCT